MVKTWRHEYNSLKFQIVLQIFSEPRLLRVHISVWLEKKNFDILVFSTEQKICSVLAFPIPTE